MNSRGPQEKIILHEPARPQARWLPEVWTVWGLVFLEKNNACGKLPRQRTHTKPMGARFFPGAEKAHAARYPQLGHKLRASKSLGPFLFPKEIKRFAATVPQHTHKLQASRNMGASFQPPPSPSPRDPNKCHGRIKHPQKSKTSCRVGQGTQPGRWLAPRGPRGNGELVAQRGLRRYEARVVGKLTMLCSHNAFILQRCHTSGGDESERVHMNVLAHVATVRGSRTRRLHEQPANETSM